MGLWMRRLARKAKTHILNSTDLPSILKSDESNKGTAGTKIAVTLGPSCHDVDTLVQLLEAGMSAARVDLTWGPLEYHRESLKNLGEASRRARKLCAVMIDTLGREIVVRRAYTLDSHGWPVHEGAIIIKAGSKVVVTSDVGATASSSCLPVLYPHFGDNCQVGDTIFVGRYLVNGADDLSVFLQVEAVEGQNVICKARNDASLDGLLTVVHSDSRGDGLSPMQADLPILSQMDVTALRSLSEEFEIDFVMQTYARDENDVIEMRAFLDDINLKQTKILAKLENRVALSHFEGIARAADGIIFSRGNLGLDVPPEKMATIQKMTVTRCNVMGKPVIITRLCDSMASAPRPTRAEATDVANAVLDGVDCMLLGAETLRGAYPVQTVKTLAQIARQAEISFDHRHHFDFLMEQAMAEEEEEAALLEGFSPMTGNSPMGSYANLASVADGVLPRGAPRRMSNLGYPPEMSNRRVTSEGGPTEKSKESLAPPEPTRRTTLEGSRTADLPPLPKSSLLLPARLLGDSRAGSHSRDHMFGRSDMPYVSSFGSLPRCSSVESLGGPAQSTSSPWMSKMEAIASTAVRAADKINASLIIVFASTGRTASLIAKYRPPMPILTLVVPQLRVRANAWDLTGRSLARQCLVMRGVIPMLAAPASGFGGETMLEEALRIAASRGLVAAFDNIVCVQSVRDSLLVKVATVDAMGTGVQRRPTSNSDLGSMDIPQPPSVPTSPDSKRFETVL